MRAAAPVSHLARARRDDPGRGIALMLLAYAFFSCTDTSVKWLGYAGIPALQLAFMRFSVHLALSTGPMVTSADHSGWTAPRAQALAMLVRGALLAAGVNETFTPVITAMMRERMNFRLEETEDDFRVAVADTYGEVGIEFAVNTWLATEGAAAYRPTPKPTDGPLMARLRQLRATMN